MSRRSIWLSMENVLVFSIVGLPKCSASDHCDEQILMIPFFFHPSLPFALHFLFYITLLYFANTLAFTICIRGSGLFWCKGDELTLLTSYSPRARDLSGSVGIAVHIFGQHPPYSPAILITDQNHWRNEFHIVHVNQNTTIATSSGSISHHHN